MSADKRPLSSRVSSFRNYLSQARADPRSALHTSGRDPRRGGAETPPVDSSRTQSWGQWAGQKLKRITHGNEDDVANLEKVFVFPGWATRNYHEGASASSSEAPFDVHVSVSGWASSHNAPGIVSRSQRAFIRLAKGYASLPKLPDALLPPESQSPETGNLPLSKSTEDLLKEIHLPPPPSEMTEEAELAALEDQLRHLELPGAASSSSRTPSPAPSNRSAASNSPTANIGLQQLHTNLEARLLPFWSSVLPARTVRLSLFAARADLPGERGAGSVTYEPLQTHHVHTATDGSFTHMFQVPWEMLCTHPRAVHVAFGDPSVEHELVVLAELLAPPPPLAAPQQSHAQGQSRPAIERAPPSSISIRQSPVSEVVTPISLSHSPVRIISDIDDTIKKSNILSGARSVFYNVFVRDLNEALIPEMPEWYNEMWKRGVRFHYVSNGPFELLPVVTEFFQISQLPGGSIKLRSYAGRSLFGGFMSAPASRKRAGVQDVLDSFPRSRFLLIGDSGEQDLELYAALAGERPQQILGVFIRDVHQGGVVPVPEVFDPTGRMASAPAMGELTGAEQPGRRRRTGDLVRRLSSTAVAAKSTIRKRSTGGSDAGAGSQLSKCGSTDSGVATLTAAPAYTPYRSSRSRASSASSNSVSSSPPSTIPDDYFTGQRAPTAPVASAYGFATTYTGTPLAEEPESAVSTPGAGGPQRVVSEPERKRDELQARIYRARGVMPEHIPLRVFRHPRECVEAGEILDRLHIGGRAG